jgi:hypothetical protein
VLNAIVATYIYTLVPEFLMRFLSWVLVNIMYRIKVRGLENIPETGPVLIVCNHVSFMDPLVIGGSVRRPVRFVMDHHIFKIPVMNFIFRTARAIPIAPAHEDTALLQKAFDQIDADLAEGESSASSPKASSPSTASSMSSRKASTGSSIADPFPWCPWRCGVCTAASSAGTRARRR